MVANSPEYITLIRCNEDLCLVVKGDLVGLSISLVSNELISPENSRELRNNVAQTEECRSANLISLIQDKVRQNPQHYHTFVSVIRDRSEQLYSDVLYKLYDTYENGT